MRLFLLLRPLLLLLFLPVPLWGQQERSPLGAEASLPAALPLSGDSPAEEIRAVWFTTLKGLDWPSRPAFTPAEVEKQKAELTARFDDLARMGVNVVLFQTRLRATTAYASDIEPWDAVFTGTVGRRPAFDPLAFAIHEAHARGMELHAWMVTFPAMSESVARQLGNRSLPRRHPSLVQRSGDAWMLDPGVPATAPYLASLCREVAERYDIDGIHLDYVRYPERGIPFNDTKTYRRYGGAQPLADWRRDNVTRVVRTIRDAVRSVKPWLTISCAPVGKYADLTRYPAGGWNARDAVFQDAQRWQREGLVDWLFPMMYFDGNHFYPFALDWKEQSGGRPVIPGLGIYFLSPREKDWALTTVTRQLHFLRRIGIGGQAFFRSRFLTDNVKDLRRFLADDFYATPALVPPRRWLDSIPPLPPLVHEERVEGGIRLSWSPPTDAHTYNIYALRPDGSRQLLVRRLEDTTYTYRPALPTLLRLPLLVTAVDRYGNSSD